MNNTKKNANKNTNNNTNNINIQKNVFNLNKFRKLPYEYNNKTECEKQKSVWLQTNPRYQKFDQLFFTVADQQDMDKYGYLPLRYYSNPEYLKNNSIKNNLTTNYKKTIFSTKNTDKIFKLYKNIDYTSVENTFNYIFHKFKKAIFVIIRNNKLVLYLPFSNVNYKNNWYNKIYFSEEEKELLESTNDYNKLKDILQKNIIHFQNQHSNQFKHHKINFNREKWIANGCFFLNNLNQTEGELNTNVYKTLLEETLKHKKVDDCEFFINNRDFPILKTDYTEPYEHLFDSDKIKIEKEYQFKKMCPIFSKSVTEKNADIVFPNEDDIKREFGKYFTDDCTNKTHKNSRNKWLQTDWNNKKSICIFRGSATGCGATVENNVRLKAADMSLDYPDLLDAKIVKFNSRMKKFMGEPIKIANTKSYRFQLGNFITDEEKSTYKYILNLDGHVSACRLSTEMSMKCCILLADSKYSLWFKYLMKPYEHYIPVNEDLSNLIEIIQWCKEHDDECKMIAENAYVFYQKYLTKDGIMEYVKYRLNQVSSHRNVKNFLDVKHTNKTIAVIVCYRDIEKSNGKHL